MKSLCIVPCSGGKILQQPEGHIDDQKAGDPPLWHRLRELRLFILGKRRLLRGLYSSLPLPERGLQESWERLFIRACSNKVRGNSFKLKRVDLY